MAKNQSDSSIFVIMIIIGNPANKDKKRPPTVGTQMKVSVTSLVKDLMSKRPHYIRCIKVSQNLK